jgi:hypothetical protein
MQTSEDYARRLIVPVSGDASFPLFTSSGLHVARGFRRVVIGGRGPYVEFDDPLVVVESLAPVDAVHHYYDEWRSADRSRLKFYRQKHRVDYADYVPGMWYATPFELFDSSGDVLIVPVRPVPEAHPDDGFCIFG